jgi:uncharacterized membrane protein
MAAYVLWTVLKMTNIASRNISVISALEKEALESRTRGERAGDAIARHAGKIWFVVMHAVWFSLWIVWNGRAIPGVRAIDPFPFQFLTLITSLESIFLALFILMSQNRAGRQADVREHLHLQIDLLAEQEATKMLQMLQSLCRYHGLPEQSDPEVRELKDRTEPENLLRELRENLPEG